METALLNGKKREAAGSRAAGRLRRAGLIPAIIYGHGETPESVAVDGEQLTHYLREGYHLVDLEVDGASAQKLLIKDVQFDHLGDTVLHVDLARVSLDERVTVSVPLKFRHTPVGVEEEEGVLITPVGEIEVECLVTNIPDEIRVDVKELHIGDSITVEDLVLPEGVICVETPETTVATVQPPEEEPEEEEVGEEGESAEPELIGREAEEGDDGEEKEEE